MGNGQALSYSELSSLADHVRTTYPGMTIRQYLTHVGFNVSSIPTDTFYALAEPQAYDAEGFFDGRGVAIRYYVNAPGVSIDDAQVRNIARPCYKYVFYSYGTRSPEVLSNGHVMQFKAA